jgi:hypothetical protein
MNITVNIVELAAELAQNELEKNTELTEIWINDGNDCLIYSEPAQDIFNNLYDEYYFIIEKCKI